MELNIDPNFEVKMTCAFKNGLRNLPPEHIRKSKNWGFDGIYLSKVENV